MRRVGQILRQPSLAWGCVGVVALVIAYLSLLPRPEEHIPERLRDKLGHILAYAALGAALAHALATAASANGSKLAFAGRVVLVAGTYGLALEVAQYLGGERMFSLGDAGVNVVGAGVGLGVQQLGYAAFAWALLLCCMPMVGSGCAASAEPVVAAQPTAQSHYDWNTLTLRALAGEHGARKRLAATAEQVRLADPGNSAAQYGTALAAYLAGDDANAIFYSERALALDASVGAAHRLLRLVRVRRGQVASAVRGWLQSLPRSLLQAPGHNVRLDRVLALRHAASGGAEKRAELAAAMVRCGWIDEGLVLGVALPAEVRADVELALTVRASLARRLPGDDLETVLGKLVAAGHARGRAELAQRLPVHSGEAGSLTSPDHPLVVALWRCSFVLDLRERGEETVARLVPVVALIRKQLPGVGVAHAAIVDGMDLGFVPTPDLGGRASLAQPWVFVDIEALRPVAVHLRQLRALAVRPRYETATQAAYVRLLRERGPDAASLTRDDAFALLLEARCEYVLWHELGHVVDLARLRPISSHLLANLGRVAAGGFDPTGIGRRYEEIAEWFALSQAPHVAAVLVGLAESLVTSGPNSVAGGGAAAVLTALRVGAAGGQPAAGATWRYLANGVADKTARRTAGARLQDFGLATGEGGT